MPSKRNKKLKYERIPLDEIEYILHLFEKRFVDFLAFKGFPKSIKINISYFTLIDIIIRADKRKAYYQCFHGMEINECKEAALYAYWIIKLRPFTIVDGRFKSNADACHINETFAIHFIGLFLESTNRIQRTEKTKETFSKYLEYSFRFRNFSIDSFIVLIESITTETLEKEYPNLSDME